MGEEDDEKECEYLFDNEEISNTHPVLEDFNQDEEQTALPKRGKWMISKVEEGRFNYIHISQAIRLLLPREYIARCRQKRHWASKYLPGKEPLNPDHDIFVFGYVALKRITEGVKTYMVSRVERIESTKDGTEVLSFKLKENPPVRLRCSPYDYDINEQYKVREEIILTPWRSPSGVLGPVELLPVQDCPGRYVLHEDSKRRLQELGYAPIGEKKAVISPKKSVHMSFGEELEEGYYEGEEVLERRLRNDMTYEFKVRFKGYGPDDDMWLPASSYNRTVSFQTTSRFGRKRKHKADDDDFTFTEPKRRKATRSPNKVTQARRGSQGKKDERGKETRSTGEEMQSKQKRETLVSRRFSKKLRFCSKKPRLASTKNQWKELSLCPVMTVTLMLLTPFMSKMSRTL